MSIEACRTIARQRWGRATAFRIGVVAGEIGARIVNPFRDAHRSSLYRQGLRWGKDKACPERAMGRFDRGPMTDAVARGI